MDQRTPPAHVHYRRSDAETASPATVSAVDRNRQALCPVTSCLSLAVMVCEVLTPEGHLVKTPACDEHAQSFMVAWCELQALGVVPGDQIATAHANPDAPVPFWPSELVTS